MAGRLRKLWERWSPSALFQTVDKRSLQHEIDIHRLFLLTSFHRKGAVANEATGKELEEIAATTPFEAQQHQVQTYVHDQVCHVASLLDGILLQAPPTSKRTSPPEGQKQRPSGLSFAIGVAPAAEHVDTRRAGVVETWPLNREQVASALGKQLGFTLQLKPSKIAHEEAGLGLFISGRAGPGTVVSLYPGVIYSPSQYRYMPGYPKVDIGNPYLISRYDGLVIDGKPWGKGEDRREWWDGSGDHDEDEDPVNYEILERTIVNADPEKLLSGQDTSTNQNAAKRGPTSIWQLVGGGQVGGGPREGVVLERRNPLALAHFANHPPQGLQPNVIICPYRFPGTSDVSIRPYIPNVVVGNDEELDMQRRGPLWVNEGRKDRQYEVERRMAMGQSTGLDKRTDIRTLVLVATREVEDEELTLNYRFKRVYTTTFLVPLC